MTACGSILLAAGLAALLSNDAVQDMFEDRATVLKSYDSGEFGRFGNQANAIPMLIERPLGFGPLLFGQIFAKDDPLVASTMAMLEATEREGMVYGTGWDPTGVWNYFASFYAHVWLWQGNGRKAAQILYAYANHASPTLLWREEQSLRGEKFRKVGDMPHKWASAEFIRLLVHLLALDREDELHLLEGFLKIPADLCLPEFFLPDRPFVRRKNGHIRPGPFLFSLFQKINRLLEFPTYNEIRRKKSHSRN